MMAGIAFARMAKTWRAGHFQLQRFDFGGPLRRVGVLDVVLGAIAAPTGRQLHLVDIEPFVGESLRLIGASPSGVILTERGPIRLRRAARADNAPATVAVDVRAPAARAAATAGGRGEPRKRSRATTSRAAPAFPLTEPDDAGLSAG